jgi:hypothetical protein
MQVKSFIQNGKRNLKLMLESNNTRKWLVERLYYEVKWNLI